MVSIRILCSLACLAGVGLGSVPASAKPVEVTCGAKIHLKYDDEKWTPNKPLDPPRKICDFVFEAKADRGQSVYVWAPPLTPKEAQDVARSQPVALLQRMVDMTGSGNHGPRIDKAEVQGAWHWAYVQNNGPSGTVAEQHVGLTRQGAILLYVVHTYEPHRSEKPVPYERAAAQREFTAWLGAVKAPASK